VQTKDGESPMLTKPVKAQLRDLTKASVSILVEHSTSDLDFQ
jgi:hypothetical protein